MVEENNHKHFGSQNMRMGDENERWMVERNKSDKGKRKYYIKKSGGQNMKEVWIVE